MVFTFTFPNYLKLGLTIAEILSAHLPKSAWALLNIRGRPWLFKAPTLCVILQIMVDKSAHEMAIGFSDKKTDVGSFPNNEAFAFDGRLF